MRLYKYKKQTIEAENHRDACKKLGISMEELKKNGRIVKYKGKAPAPPPNMNYVNKQLKKRIRKGTVDKNWYQKWIMSQLKSNGCTLCGYSKSEKALCFHHVDSRAKSFEIRIGRMRISEIQEEVAKCMCLCLNCHAIVHEVEEEIFLLEREGELDEEKRNEILKRLEDE